MNKNQYMLIYLLAYFMPGTSLGMIKPESQTVEADAKIERINRLRALRHLSDARGAKSFKVKGFIEEAEQASIQEDMIALRKDLRQLHIKSQQLEQEVQAMQSGNFSEKVIKLEPVKSDLSDLAEKNKTLKIQIADLEDKLKSLALTHQAAVRQGRDRLDSWSDEPYMTEDGTFKKYSI